MLMNDDFGGLFVLFCYLRFTVCWLSKVHNCWVWSQEIAVCFLGVLRSVLEVCCFSQLRERTVLKILMSGSVF